MIEFKLKPTFATVDSCFDLVGSRQYSPRTTARGIRASHESKLSQQWRIMWTLLSVKFVMFLGLKLLMSTRENALKFVVEKKNDVFVKQLLFFKPCRCCMHVSRCVERS